MEHLPSFVDQLDVDYICHHGVKGMKWGVRRYQNYDGTWKKKARVGSVERVRQKQNMFRSKINSDGILGKGDTNFIRRTMVNDWRRGRINQLEAKAQNREAIKAYKNNRSKENAKRVGITAAKRIGLNALIPEASGAYSRYRKDGYNKFGAAGMIAARSVMPAFNAGTMIGEAIVDRNKRDSRNKQHKQNRIDYAKRTGQSRRI